MRQRNAAAERTDARRKFSGYKRDACSPLRDLKHKNGTLGKLVETWLHLVEDSDPHCNLEAMDEATSSAAKNLICSPEDIREFSAVLKHFEHFPPISGDDHDPECISGYFLSALINQSPAQNFTVIADTDSFDILRLGYRNTKNIIIEGDSTYELGFSMKSGMIMVRHFTRELVGCEVEGGIIITQNVSGPIAEGMQGGLLIINGDVDLSPYPSNLHGMRHGIGEGMEGGEIHIYGDIIGEADFSKVRGGKIYQRGKLLNLK